MVGDVFHVLPHWALHQHTPGAGEGHGWEQPVGSVCWYGGVGEAGVVEGGGQCGTEQRGEPRERRLGSMGEVGVALDTSEKEAPGG